MSSGRKSATATSSPALPDFRSLAESGIFKRLMVTVGLLAFYRLGVQVPIWGVDHELVKSTLSSNLLGFVDLFSGGALSALSIFALGIGPYITASIMMQLLNEIFPSLKALQREQGESGRKEYQQWVRRLSVLIALIQSSALVSFLVGSGAVISPNIPLFVTLSLIALVSGSLFVLWIGELISEFGIGNGGSLLIFAGVAARLPQMVAQTYEAVKIEAIPLWGISALLVFFVLLIYAIIYLQEAARKLLIVGAKAASPAGGYQQNSHYLPMKLNPSGVLPIIFTYAAMFMPVQLLMFAGKGSSLSDAFGDLFYRADPFRAIFEPLLTNLTFAGFFGAIGFALDQIFLDSNSIPHTIAVLALIISFAFFYSSILLPPREIAENLQKSGSAIQGVKPGKATSEYLEGLLNRLVFIGGIAIGLIAITPGLVEKACQVTTLGGLGSTSLIIMVGVAVDLYNQVLAYTQAHQYKVRSLFN